MNEIRNNCPFVQKWKCVHFLTNKVVRLFLHFVLIGPFQELVIYPFYMYSLFWIAAMSNKWCKLLKFLDLYTDLPNNQNTGPKKGDLNKGYSAAMSDTNTEIVPQGRQRGVKRWLPPICIFREKKYFNSPPQ